MILERKLKQTALMAAIDLSIKRMKKSPERCARNLLELGLSAYPDKLSKSEQRDFFQELLMVCKDEDAQKARDLFISVFLS